MSTHCSYKFESQQPPRVHSFIELPELSEDILLVVTVYYSKEKQTKQAKVSCIEGRAQS